MKYQNINIEVVTGGFIFTYTVDRPASSGNSTMVTEQEREVFTSQSKLTKRVKEVLDTYNVDAEKDAE